ncbi:MAG: tetratricopeptide repeat protein [Verrucomicrobia bacterium]|jgi:TolA-binding protein|nr:tetratricopeptide repeat protein [Verrucomicrobiota bacterium]MBT7065500.1 tetratricopeptide repeat protein [Verrucomicrobiota bacterium]MBT7698889.1 tetratricopeptide repeat protein [Verrucomicrobiota bacterium]
MSVSPTPSSLLARLRLRGLLAVWLCLAVLPSVAPAALSPREIRTAVLSKLGQGAFEEAIPDLMMLIEMLGDSSNSSVQAGMEMIYYNLGVCYFFTGQFAPADKAFNEYLRKFRNKGKAAEAAHYIADCKRFQNRLDDALKAYEMILRRYQYGFSQKADIYSAIARCHLARDQWPEAIPHLIQVYTHAGDFLRRNWAATLLGTAYLKELDLEKLYPLMPFILRPNSFASRSVAFNIAALEAGDALFGDERYREALWIFRTVYPYETVAARSRTQLDYLKRRAEYLKRTPGNPRGLMRLQESLGELEAEVEAIEGLDSYDVELHYRIARGYMEFMRYREAREMFIFVNAIAEEPLAQETLYLAYQCCTQVKPWTQAYKVGAQFMEKYPAGEYFDPLTLSMAQLYAIEKRWPDLIAHLTRTLEIKPEHTAGAECMFLLGYASFMEEDFDATLTWLNRLVEKYPASHLRPDATYWIAMAHLFELEYAEAGSVFRKLVRDFPNCAYREDASFRVAVCDYGQSLFEEADVGLIAFLDRYPQSRLAGEAKMMRADVGGTVGRTDDAVRFYQQAMLHTELNAEQYNHCAFQAGTIIHDDGDYERLRQHFQTYLDKAQEGSNLPQAVYWIGVALWNQGEQAGALRFYREAVETYGNDPGAIGVDMIMDEWIGRLRSTTADVRTRARNELRQAHNSAVSGGKVTLSLRLKRALLLDDATTSATKATLTTQLLKPERLTAASPAVLTMVMELARAKGDIALVHQAARQIVATFTETDYALDARMVLARDLIEQARKTEVHSDAYQSFNEATQHLNAIREAFATSGEAAQALLLLGQIYSEQRQYPRADQMYKDVLGVREWRTVWPEALYGRGECAFAQRRFDQAAAFYERIYLMYGHYAGWSARAYYRRAECLKRLFQPEKAREVLREMVSLSSLADQPEMEKARAWLRGQDGS